MQETITQLAQNLTSVNENWYIDTYDSYTEIGVEGRASSSRIVSALDERQKPYSITETDNTYTIQVFDH